MKIRVQYTAQLRTALGREEDIELADGSTVTALIQQLAGRHVGHSGIHFLTATGETAPGLLVVVNDDVVAPASASSTTLRNGDVVSLLPPIAGG